MAEDKKTILDIVKNVDTMNLYQKTANELKNDETLTPDKLRISYGLEDRSILKETNLPKLTKQVLSEKDPTAGGTYEGSIYYSNILPQGKGDIPWTKESATIIKNASQTGAKKSDILAAQNYFADIGYMHPSEVDGKPGKQFHGMVSRWNKNAGVSKEAMFDAMETWRDNIFGGDEE
tara:strand:- start:623 stop:1153 length:531 start_codon:yes stop_codon:yes gene_type:complete